MADSQLEIVISARDDASNIIKDLLAQVSGFNSALKASMDGSAASTSELASALRATATAVKDGATATVEAAKATLVQEAAARALAAANKDEQAALTQKTADLLAAKSVQLESIQVSELEKAAQLALKAGLLDQAQGYTDLIASVRAAAAERYAEISAIDKEKAAQETLTALDEQLLRAKTSLTASTTGLKEASLAYSLGLKDEIAHEKELAESEEKRQKAMEEFVKSIKDVRDAGSKVGSDLKGIADGFKNVGEMALKGGEGLVKAVESMKVFVEIAGKVGEEALKAGEEVAHMAERMASAPFHLIGQQLSNIAQSISYQAIPAAENLGKAWVGSGVLLDDAMHRFEAVAGSTMANAGISIDDVRNKALQIGRDFPVSTSDAGRGLYELATTGISARNSIDALTGVAQLAQTQNMSMADSAKDVAAGLHAFGLEGAEATRVVADYTAVASSAGAEVQDIAASMKYAGPIAGQLGFSIEEVSTQLGVMSNVGIRGTAAGTSLRRIMLGLTESTKNSAAQMKELGISIQDSHGKMLPMANILDQLREKTANMDAVTKEHVATNIAATTGMAGLLAILNAAPDEINNVTDAMTNAESNLANYTKLMQQGLGYQLREAKGSFEMVGQAIYKEFSPALAGATSHLVAFLNSDNMKTWATNFGDSLNTVINRIEDMGHGIMKIGTDSGGFGLLSVQLKEFGRTAGDVYHSIGDFVENNASVIVNFSRVMISSAENSAHEILAAYLPALGQIGAAVGVVAYTDLPALFSAFAGFANYVAPLFAEVAQDAIDIGDAILVGISSSLEIVGKTVADNFVPLKVAFDDIAKSTESLATNALPQLVGIITKLGVQAVPVFAAILKDITAIEPVVAGVFGMLGTEVVKVAGNLVSSLLPAFNSLASWFSAHQGEVQQFFTSIGDTISTVIHDYMPPLLAAFARIGEVLVDLGPKIESTFGAVAQNAASILTQIVQGLAAVFETLKGPISLVLDVITGLSNLLGTVAVPAVFAFAGAWAALKVVQLGGDLIGLVSSIGAVVPALAGATEATGGLAAAMGLLDIALGPVGIAAMAIGVVLGGVAAVAATSKSSFGDLGQAADDLSKQLAIARGAVDDLGNAMPSDADKTEAAMQTMTKAGQQYAESVGANTQRILRSQLEAGNETLRQATAGMTDYQALGYAVEHYGDQADKTYDKVKTALANYNTAMETSRRTGQAVDTDVTKSFTDMQGAADKFTPAAARFKQSVDQIAASGMNLKIVGSQVTVTAQGMSGAISDTANRIAIARGSFDSTGNAIVSDMDRAAAAHQVLRSAGQALARDIGVNSSSNIRNMLAQKDAAFATATAGMSDDEALGVAARDYSTVLSTVLTTVKANLGDAQKAYDDFAVTTGKSSVEAQTSMNDLKTKVETGSTSIEEALRNAGIHGGAAVDELKRVILGDGYDIRTDIEKDTNTVNTFAQMNPNGNPLAAATENIAVDTEDIIRRANNAIRVLQSLAAEAHAAGIMSPIGDGKYPDQSTYLGANFSGLGGDQGKFSDAANYYENRDPYAGYKDPTNQGAYDPNAPKPGSGGGPSGGSPGGKGAGGGGSPSSAAKAAQSALDELTKEADAMTKIAAAFMAVDSAEPAMHSSIDKFLETVKYIMDKFESMANSNKKTLDAASAYVDVTLKVVDLVDKGSKAFTSLNDLVMPTQDAMANFANGILIIVKKFVDVAKEFDIKGLAGAMMFSEAATKILDVTSKVQSLKDLTNFVSPTTASMAQFSNAVLIMVSKFQGDSYIFDAKGMAGAVQFADTAGKVLDAMSKFKVLQDIAGFVSPSNDAMANISNSILVMVEKFQASSYIFNQKGLAGATLFSDTAVKVLDAVSKVTDLTKLEGYVALPDKTMDTVVADVKELVQKFQTASNAFAAGSLAGTVTFGAAVQAIFAGLDPAIKTLTSLKDFMTLGNLNDAMDALKDDVKTMVQKMQDVAKELGGKDAFAAAEALGKASSAIFDGLSKGLSFFIALGGGGKTTDKTNAKGQNSSSTVEPMDIPAVIKAAGANMTTLMDSITTALKTFAKLPDQVLGALGGGNKGTEAFAQLGTFASGLAGIFDSMDKIFKLFQSFGGGTKADATANMDAIMAGADNAAKIVDRMTARVNDMVVSLQRGAPQAATFKQLMMQFANDTAAGLNLISSVGNAFNTVGNPTGGNSAVGASTAPKAVAPTTSTQQQTVNLKVQVPVSLNFGGHTLTEMLDIEIMDVLDAHSEVYAHQGMV